MSSIQEKYDNCPKHIQEVVDLLLVHYVKDEEKGNISLEILSNKKSHTNVVSKRVVINSTNKMAVSVEYSKVVSFVLGDISIKYDKNTDWSNFLIDLGNLLTKRDRERMKELAKNCFKAEGMRFPIVSCPETIKDPEAYSDLEEKKVRIRTRTNSRQKIQMVYALIKEFGYKGDDLTIEVEKLENNDSSD